MQSCGIALLLSVILLCPLNSLAQNACFDESAASRMVIALEQAKICEQQLSVAATGSAELQQQAEILKGTIKLLEDQIAVYKNMTEMQKKIDASKDKLHAEELKAAKPSFFQTLEKVVLGFAVGVGVGVAVCLLL
jgi:hypothetical protein